MLRQLWRSRNRIRRWTAILLCLCMTVTMFPQAGLAEMTGESGYTTEASKVLSGIAGKASSSDAIKDESEDYEDIDDADDMDIASDSNADKATGSDADKLVKIRSWEFVDPEGRVLNGAFAMPGADAENQADFDTVVSMLPKEITAVTETDGEEETITVAITGWNSDYYVTDPEGNWPIGGRYVFVAELEEGYACEPMPSVAVMVGGGALRAEVPIVFVNGTAMTNGMTLNLGGGTAYFSMNSGLATLTLRNVTINTGNTTMDIPSPGAIPKITGGIIFRDDGKMPQQVKIIYEGTNIIRNDASNNATAQRSCGIYVDTWHRLTLEAANANATLEISSKAGPATSTSRSAGINGDATYVGGTVTVTNEDTEHSVNNNGISGVVALENNCNLTVTTGKSGPGCQTIGILGNTYIRQGIANVTAGASAGASFGIQGAVGVFNGSSLTVTGGKTTGTNNSYGIGGSKVDIGSVGQTSGGTLIASGDSESPGYGLRGGSQEKLTIYKPGSSVTLTGGTQAIQEGAKVTIDAGAGAGYTAKVGADENSLTQGDMSTTTWYANKYARIDELAPPEKTFAVDADYVYLDGNSVSLEQGSSGGYGDYTKFKLGDKYIKLSADVAANLPPNDESGGVTRYALEAKGGNTGRIVAAGNKQKSTYADKTTVNMANTSVKGICTGNSSGSIDGDVEVITGNGSKSGNIYLGSKDATGDIGTHTLIIDAGIITSIEDNDSPKLGKEIIIKGGTIGTWPNYTGKGLDLDFANENRNLTVTVIGKLAADSGPTYKTVKIHLPEDPDKAWGTGVTLAVCDDAAAAAFNANRFCFDDEAAATAKGWTIVADGIEIKAVNKTTAKYLWYTQNINANTFRITNADELYAFANIVNGSAVSECPDAVTSNFAGKTVYLDQDIDLKGLDNDTDAANGNWTPVGSSYVKRFQGSFSGGSGGHKISNLTVTDTDTADNNIGLFANCSTGTISNLFLEKITLTGGSSAGGIAGKSESTIKGCTVTGTITGADYAGGITGENSKSGQITNCLNQAKVSAGYMAGGIAGMTGGSNTVISDCANEGAISGYMAGGIAGQVYCASTDPGSIMDCYQTGSVTAESKAGGIAGELKNGCTIARCYTTGTITTTGDSAKMGGIVGTIDDAKGSMLQGCVALNTEVTGVSGSVGGRITGTEINNGYENYARSDMMINGEAIIVTNAYSQNGQDLIVGRTTQDWKSWFGIQEDEGWTFTKGVLSAGASLPTIKGLKNQTNPTLPQQTIALPPAFAETDNTYKMPTATEKVAKLTLTNGPADSYQIYSAETGGTVLTNPTASVAADSADPTKSFLHLTHGAAPTATNSYWVSAKMTGGAESARTKITIQQAIGTESKILAYRTNLDDGRVFEGKVEESAAKLILDNLDHSFRDDSTARLNWLPIMVRVSDGARVTARVKADGKETELTKKTVIEDGKAVLYWTETYAFDEGKTIRLTVTSEDKQSTKEYTMSADIKTYPIAYELETGIVKQSGPTGTIDLKEDFTAVFKAEAGSSITKAGVTVSVNDVKLADEDYTVTPDTDTPEISTLTITAKGKEKITGTVKVKVEQYSSAAELTNFAIANSVKQTVSVDGKTIDVQMPADTDLQALAPAFTLSSGATAVPASGVTVDFSNSINTPVEYVVTAEDGIVKNTYRVTARIPTYDITYDLKNFVVGSDGKKTADLNETLTVSLTAKEGFTVPTGTDTKNLIVTMQDIDGKDQTLTAGTDYTYTPGIDSKGALLTIDKVTGKVSITVTALHTVKEITTFEIPGQVGKTVIDQNKLTIRVDMPHGTNLTKLYPTITLKPDSADAGSATSAKVVPASGKEMDFSGTTPVKYTVTAENGTTAVYNVTVQIPEYKLDSKLTNMTVTALEKKTVNLHEPLDLTIIAATGYSMPSVTDTTNLIVTMKDSDGTAKTLTPGIDYTCDITVASPSTASLKVEAGKVTGDVHITVKALNQAKAITKFQVTGQVGATVLDEAKHTIRISMPHKTDLTKIKPIIETSADSTVSPTSNAQKDFSDSVKNPLTYTVTAENGDKQEYQVTVQIPEYKLGSKLTNMTVTALEKKTVNLHEPLDLTIIAATGYSMPVVTDTTNLIVTMKDSDGTAKTLTPGTDYTYSITVASPSTASLKVEAGNVTGDVDITLKALSQAKKITAFTITDQIGKTKLDEEKHTIEIVMPYATDLTSLAPGITSDQYATVKPANGVSTDFSKSEVTPVKYTVTAEDGSTADYQVKVWIPQYNILYDLTDTTAVGQPDIIAPNQAMSITVTAAEGYGIPKSVTIKVQDGDTTKTLTADMDYTYTPAADKNTAVIALPKTYLCTGDMTITVDGLSRKKQITEFTIDKQVGTTELKEDEGTIQVVVPYGTQLKTIAPVVVATDSNAAVNPASNAVTDFSDSRKNPVVYTVTAEDDSVKEYKVVVTYPKATVIFDSNKGTAVEKQEITAGELAVEPKNPTREPGGETYYRFDGWYADPAFTTIYDFTQKVPGDITLFAKWTAGYQVLADAVNGKVLLNGVSGATVFYPGQTVAVTAVPNSGYRFIDWSTSVDVALLADANAKETTFTMPERTVNLTAAFRRSSSGGSSGGGSTTGAGTGGADTGAPGYGGTVINTTPGGKQTVEGGIKESTDIVSKDKGGHESKVTVDVTKDLAGNVISSGADVTPAQKPAEVADGYATIAAGLDAAALNQAASIAGASAERPLPLTVTLPSASAIEQLHNPQAQSLNLDITIPKSVSGATNLRIENLRLEKAVMEAAKAAAKDIRISLKDDTGALIAEWTFAGQDLRSSTAAMTDVNLYLVLTPAKALTTANETLKNTILGISENGLVITFWHNGQLPAAARIKVASGIKTGTGIASGIKAGDVVDLYYHDRQKNTLETVAGGPYTVDAGGYVTVAITHCSDYVLIPRKETLP